jgi:ATP-dependent RNA helicase RhlE
VSTFAELNLTEPLLRALAAKGYHTPTPIQRDAIPPVMAGRDLVGCAQTGTGKTAAFALPTLHRLHLSTKPAKSQGSGGRQASRRPIRSLILAPTRELASQIAESFVAYGKHTPLQHAMVYGGVSQVPQVRNLQRGIDTLIATPGRLLDLINQGYVDLSNVEILIFDEADQMLDMGFIHDLRRIVTHVPAKRQTLMFSATMPTEIRKLAQEWLNDPTNVQTAAIATSAELVDESVYFVSTKNKVELLEQFLRTTPSERTLVFARTKHGVDKIVKQLLRGKIFAAAIHGNKSQSAREKVLRQFKSSRPPVLVATDVAARGLDITGVSHVINYDLPETPEIYVHRIGRTGRAGATGNAVSFCTSDDVRQLRAVERLTRRRIDVALDQPEITSRVAPEPTEATRNSRGRRPMARSTSGTSQGGSSRPVSSQSRTQSGGPKPARRPTSKPGGPRPKGRRPRANGAR